MRNEKLISTTEAAKIIGCSHRTLALWQTQNRPNRPRAVKRRDPWARSAHMFREVDILAYAEQLRASSDKREQVGEENPTRRYRANK